MALSQNLNSYKHIKPIMDEAAARPDGVVYTLPDAKSAIRWRLEAYQFRRLLAAQQGPTPYDSLVLRIDTNKVRIVPRESFGVLTTHDGTRIEPAVIQGELVVDPLEEFAEGFAAGLMGDDDDQ